MQVRALDNLPPGRPELIFYSSLTVLTGMR